MSVDKWIDYCNKLGIQGIWAACIMVGNHIFESRWFLGRYSRTSVQCSSNNHVLSSNIKFYLFQDWKLSIKLPQFNINLGLAFIFSVVKRNLQWGLHFIMLFNVLQNCVQHYSNWDPKIRLEQWYFSSFGVSCYRQYVCPNICNILDRI